MIQSETQHDGNYLKDIFQISTLLYISAFLTFRIAETTLHSLAMRLFSIPHRYNFTIIQHKTRSLDFWDANSVIVVYGICALVLFLFGVLQYQRLAKKMRLDWLERLMLLWLSVHFINAVVGGMISGSIVYDRFGFAMRWLFSGNTIATIGFAIIGIGGLAILAKIYSPHFLSICIHKELINGSKNRRDFLITIVFLPWGTSTLLLAPWDFLSRDYYSILQNLALFFFSIVAVFLRPDFVRVTRKAEQKNSAGIEYRQRAKRIFLMYILIIISISIALKYIR